MSTENAIACDLNITDSNTSLGMHWHALMTSEVDHSFRSTSPVARPPLHSAQKAENELGKHEHVVLLLVAPSCLVSLHRSPSQFNSDEDRNHTSRDKQQERAERIASLKPIYHEPLTSQDKEILSRSVSSLVAAVQTSSLSPSAILVAYSKKALQAHAQTNCLTEVMIASAENWASTANRSGPLAGVPVSLKDLVSVKGWDSSMGYSALVGKPMAATARW
ncbi:amidase signature domain-containing protein [Suillus spraguei]|nr:amidase signature domain-containing protein [Suillus spraguei]